MVGNVGWDMVKGTLDVRPLRASRVWTRFSEGSSFQMLIVLSSPACREGICGAHCDLGLGIVHWVWTSGGLSRWSIPSKTKTRHLVLRVTFVAHNEIFNSSIFSI